MTSPTTNMGFISKIKKAITQQKNSKYYKKFVIILKKQERRFLGKKEKRYYPKFRNTTDKLIATSSESSTSDSGISQDDSPVGTAPASILTEAFIEPIPRKFKTATRDDLNKSDVNHNEIQEIENKDDSSNIAQIVAIQDDIIQIVANNETSTLSNKITKSCSQNAKVDETPASPEISSFKVSIGSRRERTFVEDTTNEPLRKCRKTLVHENSSSIIKITPPKKPPRLHLNLKPITPIIYANIQLQPEKDLATTVPSILEISEKKETSHDAQVKNAILEVTSALKTTVQGDTFTNELYSEFRDGLKRKRPSTPPAVAKDKKFVVNIFESRRSQRWKRQSVRVDRVPKIKILDDPPKEMIHKQPPVDENEKTVPTNDEIYYKMKKMRDIECVKMKEASNALMAIKNSDKKTLGEELLAETILLETGLRYKAIVHKIRDCYNEDEPVVKKTCVSAGLTLSNFQFEIEPRAQKKTDSTTFFLLAISNDTEIIASKAIQPSGDNKLVFNKTFALQNLSENFQIKGEIFSITFNTKRPGIVEKLLRKKSKYHHSINKIYYENVNTYELQESAIIKSSFTSRGEFTMTKKDIYNSMFLLTNYDSDKLKNVVSVTASLDYVNLNDKLSGFLTLGKVNEQEHIHDWERKWCSLVNKTFSIYNYPQEEELEKPPAAFINLEYCFNPIARRPQNCPRKRTFVIKTGRPSTMNDSNCKHLKRKNNFILNKFYLSADNNSDFERWTSKLDSALDELDEWGRLIFKDESYM